MWHFKLLLAIFLKVPEYEPHRRKRSTETRRLLGKHLNNPHLFRTRLAKQSYFYGSVNLTISEPFHPWWWSPGDWQCGEKHSWTLPCFRLHPGQVVRCQGLVSITSKEKTTFLKDTSSYGKSAFSFSGIMKNAMKDRNTDFHLEEASHVVFQIAFLASVSLILLLCLASLP